LIAPRGVKMSKYNINVDVGATFTDGLFVHDGETQNGIVGAGPLSFERTGDTLHCLPIEHP
jgi:hypothetical protein